MEQEYLGQLLQFQALILAHKGVAMDRDHNVDRVDYSMVFLIGFPMILLGFVIGALLSCLPTQIFGDIADPIGGITASIPALCVSIGILIFQYFFLIRVRSPWKSRYFCFAGFLSGLSIGLFIYFVALGVGSILLLVRGH